MVYLQVRKNTQAIVLYMAILIVYTLCMARYARRSESRRAEWGKDIATRLYDNIADKVNEEFPVFMERAFSQSLVRTEK